jgi:hypothetical protein
MGEDGIGGGFHANVAMDDIALFHSMDTNNILVIFQVHKNPWVAFFHGVNHSASLKLITQ